MIRLTIRTWRTFSPTTYTLDDVAKRGHELRFFFRFLFKLCLRRSVVVIHSQSNNQKRKSQSCLKNIIIILPFIRRCRRERSAVPVGKKRRLLLVHISGPCDMLISD
jgi:hypothetical protein